MTDREVKEYLLHHYVEYLRESRTGDPLSLGDWVTVNFSNPLTRQLRELEAVGGAAGRAERFLHPASPEKGDTEVLLEGLPEGRGRARSGLETPARAILAPDDRIRSRTSRAATTDALRVGQLRCPSRRCVA